VRTLNLAIVAHVDAGKTSLTERLLFGAGVIDEIGSVDAGSTQTDTLALERQRGITIKSAVASLQLGDVSVNLIDTPGHPDFIAEVERVLGVLDGAVLVVSAVEGVQAQTRLLTRALQRLHIPTLIFVNKIDRRGADCERVLRAICERLTPAILAMGAVRDPGTRAADFAPFGAGNDAFTRRLTEMLAENSDDLLAAFVDDERAVSHGRLMAELAAQTGTARVHPVFLGSALTGAGIDALTEAITTLLPAVQTGSDADGPPGGTVFKVERGPAGEKIAYVRMFSGTVRARERIRLSSGGEARVTGVSVVGGTGPTRRSAVTGGQIGKLRGLAGARIGDTVGSLTAPAPQHQFAPPTLETVVVPLRAEDSGALHAALTQLAESDPLINLHQDDIRQEIVVSLYGEVQKEIIGATLASDFGIEVSFRETTTICVERPRGTGSAAEFMGAAGNPFRASLGLRIDPATAGSGVAFGLQIELGSLPMAFIKAVEQTVRETLRQGLRGWQVIDCAVAVTHSGYTPPPPFGWSKWSTRGADFRNLTPLVLMDALRQAGTVVCEPMHSFRLEIPADTLGSVLPVLARRRAIARTPATRGSLCIVDGDIPAAQVHQLRQMLPGLTRGEGIAESVFDHYQPVSGDPPVRPRSDSNPLNRKEYLLRVARGGAAR
jgi:ribosomal protection tetracycline resistance protein